MPFRRALMLAAVGWLLSAVLSPVFSSDEGLSGLFTNLILVPALFVLPVTLYAVRKNFSLFRIFRLEKVSWTVLWAVILLSPGLSVLLDALDRIVFSLYTIPAEYWEALELFRLKGGLASLIVVGALMIAGPVTEEILFRGVLLDSMIEAQGGLWRPMIFTSLVFALIHIAPWVLPQIFAVGMLLAVLTRGTGSVIPAIVLHALVNGMQLLVFNSDPQDLLWYENSGFVRTPMIMAAGLLLLPGWMMLRSGLDPEIFRIGQENDED